MHRGVTLVYSALGKDRCKSLLTTALTRRTGRDFMMMNATYNKASTLQAGGMIALLSAALWVVILAPMVA